MLEVEGLTRHFGGLAALDGASFAVAAGRITGLIGPNGAGKTTLFNCISGMIAPCAGRARFDGADITGWPAHRVTGRGLARTFQLARGFARMTVFEHLLLYGHGQPGEQLGAALFPGAAARAREEELGATAWSTARRLQLDAVADRLVTQISGGQKKLLEIGRALMAAPRMILLDEPMAGVNPSLRNEIAEHLSALRADGMTLLLIEHDMTLIRALCDEVIVMAEGRFLARGSFADITADTRVQEAYLGRHIESKRESKRESTHESARGSGLDPARDPALDPALDPARDPALDPALDPARDPALDPARDPARDSVRDPPRDSARAGALSLVGVAGGYGAGEDIVKGVDLEVAAGELVVIVGPNGAGKSTLLKIVAGLLPARRGHMRAGDTPLPSGDPQRIAGLGVGFVPQEQNVFATMSVRENLEIGGYLAPRESRQRAAQLLARFPMLAAKARAPAGSLSGGQRQILALAIALMLTPKLLLLDEPSAGLSPLAATELFDSVRALAAEGIAIVMVEQNALAALAIADRGMLMVQGQKASEGAAAQMAADPETRRLFLGG